MCVFRSVSSEYSTDLSLFSLSAPGGRHVLLSPVGAAVQAVFWPDAGGAIKNIALAAATPGDYAGVTLGPLAGRLANARYTAPDNSVVHLCANEGPNLLHGGAHGLAQRAWAVGGAGADACGAWMTFCCRLCDGDDGFPGKRYFTARYRLSKTALEVTYTAETNKSTLISMSNHTYWNLSGDFSHACDTQLLQLHAAEVLYNDTAHLPISLHSYSGTAFDFSAPVSLSAAMARCAPADADALQLANARGYNNGFLLTSGAPFAAQLYDASSGRRLTLTTDQTWLVLYSGGYLPVPGCALALEAQSRPGAGELLLPGQLYRRFIRFELDIL